MGSQETIYRACSFEYVRVHVCVYENVSVPKRSGGYGVERTPGIRSNSEETREKGQPLAHKETMKIAIRYR